jgi:SAM-dependent methyltransferase
MAFDVAADAYDRFMGRYSRRLAPLFADFAGLTPGEPGEPGEPGAKHPAGQILDVGAGPGALATELARRLGGQRVVAIEPSAPFVGALRTRLPDVRVVQGFAEDLPFADDSFDASLAQLVVHFMKDPIEGLREMRRVTKAGGVVAACVWDLGGGRSPMSPFWRAAAQIDPGIEDETERAGVREGRLAQLFEEARLRDVETTELKIVAEHATFEEWWDPFTGGAGPAGAYLKSLDTARRAQLRYAVRSLVGTTSIAIDAVAWAARGRA